MKTSTRPTLILLLPSAHTYEHSPERQVTLRSLISVRVFVLNDPPARLGRWRLHAGGVRLGVGPMGSPGLAISLRTRARGWRGSGGSEAAVGRLDAGMDVVWRLPPTAVAVAGGLLRTSTRPTLNLLLILRASVHPPRVCVSIHPEGKSCSDQLSRCVERAFTHEVSHSRYRLECLVSMTLPSGRGGGAWRGVAAEGAARRASRRG